MFRNLPIAWSESSWYEALTNVVQPKLLWTRFWGIWKTFCFSDLFELHRSDLGSPGTSGEEGIKLHWLWRCCICVVFLMPPAVFAIFYPHFCCIYCIIRVVQNTLFLLAFLMGDSHVYASNLFVNRNATALVFEAPFANVFFIPHFIIVTNGLVNFSEFFICWLDVFIKRATRHISQ